MRRGRRRPAGTVTLVCGALILIAGAVLPGQRTDLAVVRVEKPEGLAVADRAAEREVVVASVVEGAGGERPGVGEALGLGARAVALDDAGGEDADTVVERVD